MWKTSPIAKLLILPFLFVLPFLGMAQQTVTLNTVGSGIWYPPVGCTSFYVEMWGGGGGGSYWRGGNGSNYQKSTVYTVTPSTSANGYLYIVGAAGTAGVDGGDTRFNNCYAYGGTSNGAARWLQPAPGGEYSTSFLGGRGGDGGTCDLPWPFDDYHLNAGGGGSGYTYKEGGFGTDGSYCTDGKSGSGTGNGGDAGQDGKAPGGGGGGSANKGGRGEIRIYYTCASTPGTIGNEHTVPYPRELNGDLITNITSPTGYGYTFTWQDSTAGGAWTTIPNANQISLAFPEISTDTYYRRLINGCGTDTISNVVKIKVFSNATVNPGFPTKNGKIDGYVKSVNGTGVKDILMVLKKNIALKGSPQSHEYYATTDDEGHYIFQNIFYGDFRFPDPAVPVQDPVEVQFTVYPVKANHVFSDTALSEPNKFLSFSERERTFRNIIDSTVYDITGKVFQQCIGCLDHTNTAATIQSGGEDVYISGFNSIVSTDSMGRFNGTIENAGIHTLTPNYPATGNGVKHQFNPVSRNLPVYDNVSGVIFEDTTTHTISGKLTAGGGDYIGQAELEFSDTLITPWGSKIPTFRKRVTTAINTGDFFIRLPARKNYQLKIVSFTPAVPANDPAYISEADFLDFFNNLASNDIRYKNETTYNIDSSDIVRNITYHRKPELELIGLNDTTCANIGVVFYQDVPKEFKVNIWEGPKVLGYKVVTSDPAPFAETSQKASLTVGSDVLTLSTTNNKILVGQYVTGEGIPSHTAVKAIAGTSLTLSKAATLSGTSILSFGKVVNQTASFGDTSRSVTLSAPNAAIQPGAVVTGPGIAPGTTVAAYNLTGTSLFLSANTLSAGSGVALKFGNLIDIKDSSLTIGDSIQIYTDILDQTGTAAPEDYYLRTSFGILDTYVTPGVPNIIAPFKKIFTVKYTDRFGRAASEISKTGVVTGIQSPPNTFTTVAPEIPEIVLHRPPGDLSYSFWEAGAVFETTKSLSYQKGIEKSGSREMKTGIDRSIGVFGQTFRIKIDLVSKLEYEATAEFKNTDEWTETFTTKTRYSTSTNGFIYAEGKNEGDVFVGAATNYIYGISNQVEFNDNCALEMGDVLVIAPQGFATTFTYSEYFITHTLMPSLQYFSEHAANDSTRKRYLDQVNVWRQVLENNDKVKANAEFVKNRSFDGGVAPIEESYTAAKSESSTIDFNLNIDASIATQVGATYDNNGSNIYGKIKVSLAREESNKTTNATETTTGYVLGDKNFGDYYSVDVKKDGVYGTPAFSLVAGTSSCPPEPGAQSRDFPLLLIDSTSINNLPLTGESFFKIRPRNASQSRETRRYNLLLNNATAIGLTISVDGKILGSAGSPINYALEYLGNDSIEVSVRKTNPADPTLSYPGVELHLVDGCFDLEDGNGIPSIAGSWNDSYKAIDINFVSACGGISLVTPADTWVVAAADNNILPVTFNGYQKSSIDTVFLQYARVGSNTWNTGYTLSNSQITDPTQTSFNWDVSTISNFLPTDSVLANYKIRLQLRCLGGSIIYSKVVQGVIDRSPPFLTGKPEPTDNVFVLGDQISFSYNEAIQVADVENNVELVLLSGNTVLPITASVFENKITIVPPGMLSSYAGDSCRVVVRNVSDIYGNLQTRADTFYFSIGNAPIVLGGIPVKLYVVRPSMPENSSGEMEIHFKLPDNYTNTTPLKVYYNVSGTAFFNSDYTVKTDTLTKLVLGKQLPIYNQHNSSQGFIHIGANRSEAILRIRPVHDAFLEGDETVKISLISGAGYVLEDSASATTTITDAVSIVSNGPLELCSAGTVKLFATPAGNSLQFDGINDYLAINNTLGNFGTGDFTIELDIKTTSFITDIFSKRGVCNLDNYINLKVYNNRARFEISENAAGANFGTITSSSVINNNEWHHIAVTRLSGIITLYVDGVAEGNTVSNADINNDYPFVLGTSVCVPFLADYMSGNIDEVRVWNKARTAAQIMAGKNIELPGNSAGLSAYYKFNEQTGNTTADASVNEYTGTLMNGAARVLSTAPVQYANYFWSPGGATTSSIQAGTGSYTLQVIDLNGQLVTTDPVQVIIGTPATVDAGSLLANQCPGVATGALGGSYGGGATGALWSDNGAGGSFTNNSGSTPQTATYIPSSNANGIITLKLTSIGSCAADTTKPVFVNGHTTWLGISADWGNGSNWSNGVIPASCTRVTIPNGVTFMPTISGTDNVCYKLMLQPGAVINVAAGAHLLITGKND